MNFVKYRARAHEGAINLDRVLHAEYSTNNGIPQLRLHFGPNDSQTLEGDVASAMWQRLESEAPHATQESSASKRKPTLPFG